jgi:hypothetical protein
MTGRFGPQNFPETLIWYFILCIYPIYYLGALYVCAPLLACILVGYMILQWWEQDEDTPEAERVKLSASGWAWLIAMGVVALALFVGCINFDWGPTKTISAFVNRWMRTWGLFALFPLVGHLPIRPQLIYRAVSIFCIQSLVLVVAFRGMMEAFDSYNYWYLSPLHKLGGGDIFYNVRTFGSVLDVSEKRLQMIAPWPPGLGLVGDIFFFLCLQEKKLILRYLGMAGAIAMVVGSVSRTALLCIPIVYGLVWVLSNWRRPWLPFVVGGAGFGIALFFAELVDAVATLRLKVREYRKGSSKARDILEQLAIDAWRNEAPIWGHGTVAETGPAITGFRGIGSHHTWYGILYVHGLVGALALGMAFLWSFLDLLSRMGTHRHAKVGLYVLCVMFVFSFSDNLDGLAYLYWPGLVVLGIAFNEELPQEERQQTAVFA